MATKRHRQPIKMGEPPEPGFYIRRLVRGGPLVGCQITYDAAEGFKVMQDGVWQGPSQDPWLLPLMHDVAYADPATDAEVKFRVGVKRWAEIYQPDHAAANPRKPIDPNKSVPF